MSIAKCEIILLKNLLADLKANVDLSIELLCDNKSAIQIVAKLVFH